MSRISSPSSQNTIGPTHTPEKPTDAGAEELVNTYITNPNVFSKTAPKFEKPIEQRAIKQFGYYAYSLNPVKGLTNVHLGKELPTGYFDPENIPEDCAVVTLGQGHIAALLGGWGKGADQQEKADHLIDMRIDDKAVLDHVGPTVSQLLSAHKRDLSAAVGLFCLSIASLGTILPVPLVPTVGFGSIALMVKGLGKLRLKTPYAIAAKLEDLPLEKRDKVSPGPYIPVPLAGLDTAAMRKRAAEIKEEGVYNELTQNCAWATLECLKAGLPAKVAAKLPSPRVIATPTDVENAVSFLINKGFVQQGEVDEEGVAWFDC